MSIFYKHFIKLRTALCAYFLACFVLIPAFVPAFAPAFAMDNLFTVENISVDVTAENAIAAREKAFDEAQIKAFEALASRMLPETELATFTPPDALTISTMINDFELLNEQLSAIRYLGTYTFRFKDSAVRKYFSQSETTYSDVSSSALLVLPFVQGQAGLNLWTRDNLWMKAWNRTPNDSSNSIVPLRLPLGDIDDVRDIADNEALSYAPHQLNRMLARYDAQEAVIAIAMPSTALAPMKIPTEKAAGRLSVEVYRTDRGRPELVQQVNVIANGIQTVAQLYDTAVIRVQTALQKDWKEKTVIRSSQQNRIEVKVPITSLSDWVGIQSDLKRVTGIGEITVKSLSANQAIIDIIFRGDADRLLLSLGQAGMTIDRREFANGETDNVLRKQTRPQDAYQKNNQEMRF